MWLPYLGGNTIHLLKGLDLSHLAGSQLALLSNLGLQTGCFGLRIKRPSSKPDSASVSQGPGVQPGSLDTALVPMSSEKVQGSPAVMTSKGKQMAP